MARGSAAVTRSGWLLLLGLAAGLAAPAAARASDHRDGTVFPNTAVNGRSDVNDIYVFRSPTNANNTVFIFTFQPFPGNLSPSTTDPTQQFDIRIDTTGDVIEDIAFRVTYGLPDAAGVQDVTLRGLPAARFPPTGVLARGQTGQNLPIPGGGMFRSAIQDDPFFFDAGSFGRFVSTGNVTGGASGPRKFPQDLGVARNFFGPNVNTFAIIIEVPSSRIGPVNSLIGVHVVIVKDGETQDRMGRPAISTMLIPRVPRDAGVERRDLFNTNLPKDDAQFVNDMIGVFEGFYQRTHTDAVALTSLLLPDVLIFQIGNPNGLGTFVTSGTGQGGMFAGTVFGNGRRLRDDVMDIEINIITNGLITTDNVPDDNGTRITDGNMGTTAAFPYIGPANLPLNGPGTGPNPTPPPP